MYRRRPAPVRAGPPAELYALGSKPEDPAAPPPAGPVSQREDGPPAKRRIAAPPGGMIALGASAPPAEPVLFSVPTRPPGAGPAVVSSSLAVIDVPPSELAERLQEALGNNDSQRAESIICGTLKQLREGRGNMPSSVLVCLMAVAKVYPKVFTTAPVVQALTEILRRDPSVARNAKVNPNAAVTACAILLHAFEEDRNWPESFVYAFVEDSLHERTWVDRECCRKFVENIVTAFGTVMPTSQQLNEIGIGAPVPRPSISSGHALIDSAEGSNGPSGSRPGTPSLDSSGMDNSHVKVMTRYHSPNLLGSLRQLAMHHVGEILQRRPNQPMDTVTRNSLRFLAAVAGLASVRSSAVPRLEQWMQNAKLQRYAQELLLAVCINTGGSRQEDNDIMNKLVQVRLKPKQLGEKYIHAMKELLSGKYPDNPSTLLNCIIFNELSTQRNPNNMPMLSHIFQHDAINAPKALAFTFQTLLLRRDDYLRALRGLLREIVRQLRGDIDFAAFTRGLLQKRKEISDHPDAAIRERIVNSTVDLTCVAVLLAAQPCLRDNTAPAVAKCHSAVSQIMRDALWWLHEIVPQIKVFKDPKEAPHYKAWIRKVLFLDTPDVYTLESWPAESERLGLLHFITNALLREETIMTLLVIGLTQELPFTHMDALDYADRLVQRAAAAHTSGLPTLSGIESSATLFPVVMKCALYTAPPHIILPDTVVAPHLAVSSMFWKGWLMLFTLAAFNPKTIGDHGWKTVPLVKCLMEMAMTNTFSYPPSLKLGETKEEVLAREQQQRQLDREEVFAYENYLSQACKGQPITESTSLLVKSIMKVEDHYPARRPPKDVLDRLQHLSRKLKLGDRLCRSRDPDFLLDIINAQGAAQSLSWLAELVASGEGSGPVDLLPTPSLCEFLIAHAEAETDAGTWAPVETKEHMRHVLKVRREELEARVKSLMWGEESSVRGTKEVLEYFFKKLASNDQRSHRLGFMCLSSVLKDVPALLATTPMDVVQTPVPNDDDDDFDVQMLLEEKLASGKGSSPGHSSLISSLPVDSFELPALLKVENAWLLVNLPRLKRFESALLPMVIKSLRAACEEESDPNILRAVICFLACHSTNTAKDTELPRVAMTLGNLVVTRPKACEQLMNISSATASRPEAGDELQAGVLSALLTVFGRALQLACSASKRLECWDENATLMVQFPSGEMVALHVYIIHAIVGLLCQTPVSENPLHAAMLDIWFPASGALTTAFILGTDTEAEIFSEALCLKMVCSRNSRVVNAAVHCATTSQLFQNLHFFGLPTSSISQILQALDGCLLKDPSPLSDPAVNKSHLREVLSVHHGKGAEGGELLLQLLGTGDGLKASLTGRDLSLKCTAVKAAEPMLESPGNQSAQAPLKEPTTIDGWQSVVSKVFIEVDFSFARSHADLLVKAVQTSLSSLQRSATAAAGKREIIRDESVDTADQICVALQRILASDKAEAFATALSQRPTSSCRLLQLLSARQSVLQQQKKKPSTFFSRLLQALSKNGHHMQSGPFSHSLAVAVKCFGKTPTRHSSDAVDDVEAALAALVPQHFTRVKKEPGIQPPSFVCLLKPSLGSFAVQRAIRALKAAKDQGRAVDQMSVRKAVKELARCQSMHLEQFIDVLFTPCPSTGKLLQVFSDESQAAACPSLLLNSMAVSGNTPLVQLACSLLSGCSSTPCIKQGSGTLFSELESSKTGLSHLAGLLVDRLQLLDPELTQISPHVQRLLLFSRLESSTVDTKKLSEQEPLSEGSPMDVDCAQSRGDSPQQECTSAATSAPRHSVLLSLLAHNSSWSALQGKFNWLLSKEHSMAPGTDAKASLDFLNSCLNLPQLRLGRVRKDFAIGAESRGVGEDRMYLHMSEAKVSVFVELILRECHDMTASSSSSSSSPPASSAATSATVDEAEKMLLDFPRISSVLQSRVSALLVACDSSERHLGPIVRTLCQDADWAAWLLLAHLYLAQPSILQHVDRGCCSRLFSLALFQNEVDCVWDSSTQALITKMSQPASDEASGTEQAADAYLKCRFLASMHPALFLRHAGVLSAFLRGRTHLSFKVFQGRQHHVIFTYALSLLDSARPYVFHASIGEHLLSIVTGFTELLQHYCTTGKAFASLADRIAQFLLAYMKESGPDGLSFLKSRMAVWRAVAKAQSKSIALQQLYDSLSTTTDPASASRQDGASELTAEEVARQKVLLEDQEADLNDMAASVAAEGVLPAVADTDLDDKSELSMEKVVPFLQDLEPGTTASGLHSTLIDLDNASMKCPPILKHFLLHLEQQLMSFTNSQSCLLAMKLLVRYIRNNPQETDRFVPAFLNCLQSPDLSVVMAAIQSVPELVIFSQRFAHQLLTESFTASVTRSLDSSSRPLLRGLQLYSI